MLLKRPRRNRQTAVIRQLVQETTLSVSDFIFPLFITEGNNKKEEIKSMPNIFRFSTDLLLEEIAICKELGINSFALFPHFREELKDSVGSLSYQANNMYLNAIHAINQNFTDVCIISDIALDPYSSDGHDGIVKNGKILNDDTLEVLGKMAVAQAQAGATIVAPSDMMDGRVQFIREALDKHGFYDVAIMAYTAKYASAFYGPFRDALDSAPRHGDKKTYQMNPANVKEALIEAELDLQEGADFLMVKPALSYLDVIKTLADNYALPIAAYNVSGEYAMVKAAAQQGWLDNDKTMYELLLSIRRAGAKVILSYFAKEFAEGRQLGKF